MITDVSPDEYRVQHFPRGDGKLFRAIRISFYIHLGLLAALWIKSIVMPEPINTRDYIPSLRVDLVALPTHKMNEKVIPSMPADDSSEKIREKEPPKIKDTPTEKGDYSLKKSKNKERMKSALDRLKSLEKIKSETAQPIMGNKVMKGSSSTGEARDAETTYFDVVLEKVRAEWELPTWLQEKGLSAKVIIYINRTGRIVRTEMVRSSGNAQFDAAVSRALSAAAPFPNPPLSVVPTVAGDGIMLGFPL